MKEVAARIDRDHGNDGVVVVVVMKGAAIFAADLVRAMQTETELAYLTASSYVDGFTPGESLSLQGDLDLDVGGRDVLIVDDIIDTGRTLEEISALITARGPRRVATVALVSKTSRRSPDTEPDYHGLEISDEFIYGYGLDWDERYRDLPLHRARQPLSGRHWLPQLLLVTGGHRGDGDPRCVAPSALLPSLAIEAEGRPAMARTSRSTNGGPFADVVERRDLDRMVELNELSASFAATSMCRVDGLWAEGTTTALLAEALGHEADSTLAFSGGYHPEGDSGLAGPVMYRWSDGGPLLDGLQHDDTIRWLVEQVCETALTPVNAAYLYYRPGYFCGLHTDRHDFEAQLLVDLTGGIGPLMVHPELADVPVRELAEMCAASGEPSGGVPVEYPRHGVTIFDGTKLPHRRPAYVGASLGVVASMCYRSDPAGRIGG